MYVHIYIYVVVQIRIHLRFCSYPFVCMHIYTYKHTIIETITNDDAGTMDAYLCTYLLSILI